MKRAGKKLRSERGASLMMALLLFLVCAVLGSVVLVAGTVSSGRLANLAEMEQHYYAVNSAAELLRSGLCGKDGDAALIFQRSKIVTESTPLSIDDSGNVTEGSPTTEEKYRNLLPDVSAADPGAKLQRFLGLYLIFGTDEVSADGTKEQYERVPGAEGSLPEDFSFTITVDGKEELQVDVKPSVKNNGQLELELQNHKGTDKYKLYLLLAAQLDPELSTSESSETKSDAGAVILEQIRTETKTNKISWSFVGLRLPEEETAEEGSGT